MSFHGLIILHCLYYHNLFIHLLRNTLLLPSFGNCESGYYKHLFPRVCPSSCPLHWWCHPTISCSVALFSCLQSFPASGSFPMSQLFASGSQRIGASASHLPMSIQGWFPLRLAGLISLLSKGLLSLLQHHSSKTAILLCSAFFMIQLSHPYMTIGKTIAMTIWPLLAKWCLCFLRHCLGLS